MLNQHCFLILWIIIHKTALLWRSIPKTVGRNALHIWHGDCHCQQPCHCSCFIASARHNSSGFLVKWILLSFWKNNKPKKGIETHRFVMCRWGSFFKNHLILDIKGDNVLLLACTRNPSDCLIVLQHITSRSVSSNIYWADMFYLIKLIELAWRSSSVMDCHATDGSSIPDGNGVKTELRVLRKGQ